MTTKKRITLVSVVAAFLLFCTFYINVSAFAAEELQFDKEQVTVNVYNQNTETVKIVGGTAVSAESEDPTLAVCYPWFKDWQDEHYFYVEPTGDKIGTTNIVVTDDQGQTKKVKVTVEGPFKLNYNSVTISQTYNNYYHHSNPDDIYLYGLPSYVIYSHSPVDDSGNIILREDEFDGQCPYSKVIFSKAVFDNYGDFYNDGRWTRYISKVVSKNTSIVKVRSDGYTPETWEIIPVTAGTATIECTDTFGQKANLTVTVAKSFVDSYIKTKTSVGNLKYGTTSVSGYTLKGAAVTARYAGKTYKTTANSNGKYSFKIPIKKIGTAIKYTFSYGGGQYTVSKKVVKPGSSIVVSRLYRTSKKVTVTVKNVHKGDKVEVKTGNKTYKKTIKKDAKKLSYKIKIKRNKAGTKVSSTVNNKFKQKIAAKSQKVYYASKVKRKMTKKQCLLVPKWEKPKYKRKDGDMDVWYYDFDGDGYDAYLLFIDGKLSDIHYY